MLPSGGDFVETIKKLPARTKFGPLVGVRTSEKSTDAHVQAPFVWKVRHLYSVRVPIQHIEIKGRYSKLLVDDFHKYLERYLLVLLYKPSLVY